MSLFKKKSSSEEAPEIPTLPELPSFSQSISKPSVDLPAMPGDARDISNQEAIKSAIDSSEKISGDSGAVNSPSENLQIPPVSSQGIPPLPSAPYAQPRTLPELPKFESKQPPFVNKVPEPPIKQTPLVNPFIESTEPDKSVPEPIPQEEKTVRRDAADSIFVRIDKFNSAKRDVEEIGRDLKQITQVIEKINDIKLKEDEEVTEINKTLEEIKNRINRIELDVFNRI